MSKGKSFSYEQLNAAIRERGQKILERFESVAISGVENSELFSIIGNVTSYWKDMFRPALASFSCEAVGGQIGLADDSGLMFTLAAAGFGLHDDILDESLNKHFRRTILGIHGHQKSLLAGDFLIVKAWTLIGEIMRKTEYPTRIAAIVDAYGKLIFEICEAEFMEISCIKNLEVDLEDYHRMLWKSTADSEACTRIGAMLGNGSKDEVNAIAEFGRRLGFMYRLVDDLKDSLNMDGNLPHRLKYERVPLPLLFAAKTSDKKHLRIKCILEKTAITPHDVKILLETCFETESFEYIKGIAKENSRKASHKLRALKPSYARRMLALMNRKSLEDVSALCL
jgi:geranylgeranyl diphosphate synthase type I